MIGGSIVALYGPVGPMGASQYTVRVNGGTPTQFSAKRQVLRNQQLLFFAGDLGRGPQRLEMTFWGDPGEELAIDFANIYVPRKTES